MQAPNAAQSVAATDEGGLGAAYLDECQALVIAEIRAIIRAGTAGDDRAYTMMLDYPLRRAKGLRPALCIAVCRALGGTLEEVLPSAAVLEIYHNAFLIHDDIEDGSLRRRGLPALHRTHGVAAAVNCGDGLLALTLRPLLDNTDRLGVGRALRILEIYATTATESFEGQSQELSWIADGTWELGDADYEAMVLKKTCGYSFIAPALVGAAVARAAPAIEALLVELLRDLGLAFQIQDDVLNLEEHRGEYGKELAGDLWEGKRTLILLHALRHMPPADRARALQILGKARPAADAPAARLGEMLAALWTSGVLDDDAHRRALEQLTNREQPAEKTDADVRFLSAAIDAHGSLDYARTAALTRARAAQEQFQRLSGMLPDSVHVRFLGWLIDYVVKRVW